MNKIINTIEQSLEIKNYYSAMYVVLALIGSCSRKQFPKNDTDNKLDSVVYKRWIDTYLNPLWDEKYSRTIPSDTIYQLRCSILHESTTELRTTTNGNDIEKIIVTTTGSHFFFLTVVGKTEKNEPKQINEIQVNAEIFTIELLESIKQWKIEAENNGIITECGFDILNGSWSSATINGSCAAKDCK